MTTDRFGIHQHTSSAMLPKDDTLRSTIRVNSDAKRDGALFPRQLDFWFASIAYALQLNLEPWPEAGFSTKASEFVKIGYGDERVLLHDWQITPLNALYLSVQEAFGAKPFDPDRVNTTAGRAGAEGNPAGRSEVIHLANRYACAGAGPFAEVLFAGSFNEDTPETFAAMKLLPLVAQAERALEGARLGGGDASAGGAD